MPLAAQPTSEVQHRCLVVLLHAYRNTPDRLNLLAGVVRELKAGAHILTPQLPLTIFSRANLDDVASQVVGLIDHQMAQRAKQAWPPFEEIILIGHSTGSMIARKAYVLICGETSEAPFMHRGANPPALLAARPWADKVTRIIQLSGMNGGWTISHHMGLVRAAQLSVGSMIASLIEFATRNKPAIFHIRKGSPFLNGLRLQWLAMQKRARAENKEPALVVQLLGTVDDLVSPEDNLDLVTGNEFLYLDVPHTGHVNVVEIDGSKEGQARRAIFELALLGTKEQIKDASVVPTDLDLVARNRAADFTDVIFVIHGIRDLGFWTHKIARKIQTTGRKLNRSFATETSTYGYFPMLSFLLPWHRREKVAWLMNRYVTAKALYPNARFSYVGHSNGTYLLISALEHNPACSFDNVVFAGSVVRRDYDWARASKRGQVRALLNYVASNDRVVACFPAALEQIGLDLGSAGHNGFTQCGAPVGSLQASEVRFVEGGHSAALSEEHWEEIAKFICTAERPTAHSSTQQNGWTTFFGRFPWIVWIVILSALAAIGWALWQIPIEWLRTVSLIAFIWAVLKILTRF